MPTPPALRYAKAEFFRIASGRVYRLTLGVVPFLTLLLAIDTLWLAVDRSALFGDGLAAYQYLFHALWERGLFVPMVAAAAAFWAGADTSHGMLRVVCTQPLTRRQIVCGKSLATAAHASLLSALMAISQVALALLAVGWRRPTWSDGLNFVTFVIFVSEIAVTWALIGSASALIRRSVASGLVAMVVFVTVVGAVTAVAPPELRYLSILPHVFLPYRSFTWPAGRYSFSFAVDVANTTPAWTSSAVCAAWTVAVLIVAYYVFKRRDILE